MTPIARLRRSSSTRTACARRTRIASTVFSGAPCGSSGAAGFATATSAIRIASLRSKSGVSRLWKRRT